MKRNFRIVVALLAVAMLFAGCDMLSGVFGTQAPTADAGDDMEVVVNSLVELDGSNSSDPDGDPILSYSWSFDAVPSGVTEPDFDNPDNARVSFTPTEIGSYIVRLQISDEDGTAADTVEITVVEQLSNAPAAVPQNFAGVADNEQVKLSWDTLDGLSYNIYWKNQSGVIKTDAVLADVSSPYYHTPPEFGVTYSYAIEAVNDVGPSDLSEEVSVDHERLPAPTSPSVQSLGGPNTGQFRAIHSNGNYMVLGDSGGHVWVSSDSGASWSRVENRLPAEAWFLFVDSDNQIYALYRDGTELFARDISATNLSAAWSTATELGDTIASNIPTDAEIFESGGTTYIVVTTSSGPDDSIYLYANDGVNSPTNTNVSPSTATGSGGGRAVTVSPNYVFYALDSGEGNDSQFYYIDEADITAGTSTARSSWTAFETGLPAGAVANGSLEMEYVDYFQHERLFLAHLGDTSGLTLSVIDFENPPENFTGETFERADDGNTLPTSTSAFSTNIVEMIADGNKLVLVYGDGSTYSATVAGSSQSPPYAWSQGPSVPAVSGGTTFAFATTESADGSYWVAGYGGLVQNVSYHGSGSFVLASTAPPAAENQFLAGVGDILYAGSDTGLFSYDGSSWTRVGDSQPPGRLFGYGRFDDRIYASTNDGLYSIKAGESSWTTELGTGDGDDAEVIVRLGNELYLDGDRNIGFYNPATATYTDTGEYGVLANPGFTDGTDVYYHSTEGDGLSKWNVSEGTSTQLAGFGNNLIDAFILDGSIYALEAGYSSGTYQVLTKGTGVGNFAALTSSAPGETLAAGLYSDDSRLYAAYGTGELYQVDPSNGSMNLYATITESDESALFMSDGTRPSFPPGIPMLLHRGVFYVGSSVGAVYQLSD